MICRLSDLREKEVINIQNGSCLGCVSDLEIDTCCAKVTAIVIYGKSRFFGLLGREEDLVICWDEIQCIGEDTVLVKTCPPPGGSPHRRRRESLLDRLLG